MFGEKLEGEKLSSPTECFEDRFARRTVKSMCDCVSVPIAGSTSMVTVLLCILSLGCSGFLCAILAQFSGYNTTIVETELLSEAQRESCCCWLADALDNLT